MDTRLKALGLETLEERRVKSDLFFAYKIVFGMVNVRTDEFFHISTANTRQGGIKFVAERCRLNLRQNYFTNRAIRLWNQLKTDTLRFSNFSQFKKALDSSENRVVKAALKSKR